MKYLRAANLAVATVTTGILLAGCGSSKSASSSSRSSTTASTTNSSVTTSAVPLAVKVQLGFIPNIQNYAVTHGIAVGAYKASGLDVSFQTGGNGIDPVKVVGAGKADIGIANENSIIAAEGNGLRLEAIGAEFGKSPLGMLCRNDSGVQTLADIAGKTIGVRPISSTDFNLLLSANNVDPKSVHVVNISNTDEATLIAGHVACEFGDLALNEPQIVQNAGVPNHVLLDADYGLGTQENVYFTTESYYQAHMDDVIKPWLKVTQQQWSGFLANPSAAVDWDMSSNLVAGLDRGQEQFQANAMGAFINAPYDQSHGLLALDPSLWTSAAQRAYATKTTPSLVDVTSMLGTAALAPVGQ